MVKIKLRNKWAWDFEATRLRGFEMPRIPMTSSSLFQYVN